MELRTDQRNLTDKNQRILTDNQKLEVKAARLPSAVSAAILLICTSVLLITCFQAVEMSPMLGVLAVFTALLSMINVNLVFRTRPLYEIDARGITDNGLIGRGYGLIEWRNIQRVQTFREQSSTSLLIKVDNFDELLDRRNLLLRPILWVYASLSAILGGELSLSDSLGDVGQEALLERISDFSRQSGRDVVVPRRGFVRELIARASLVAILLVIFAIIGLLGFDLYRQWSPRWNPSLKILGGSASFPAEVPTGKLAWVDTVFVQNYGGDAKGIIVGLSGSALDSGLLTQPRVLIQYDEDGSSLFRKRTRELLPLHQEEKNHWSGTSSTANIPTKNSDVVEAINFMSPYGQSMLKNPIGWWSDTTRPNLTVDVFAHAPRKGSGALTVNVTPITCPSASISQTKQVRLVNDEPYEMQLYSVSVPNNYPITLYPGGQIIWLSPVELKFDSDAKPSAIASYYKNELQHRGWKLSPKEDQNQLELTATKAHDSITIKIAQIPGHSPVEVHFRSDQ